MATSRSSCTSGILNAAIVACGLIFICAGSEAQFTRSKGFHPWAPDTASMQTAYWNAWLQMIPWDTIPLRPHQTFSDSLEGGRFTLSADTVTGRGSFRRTLFSWLWTKDTSVARDTFSLPMLNYGTDPSIPSDSLRVGESHSFLKDTLATECIKVEPVTITGNGSTVQTRIRVAKVGIVRW